MLPHRSAPYLSFTWVNFDFARNFRLEETVAGWPVCNFGWKPSLLIPATWQVAFQHPEGTWARPPETLAHCYACVVWWATTGNITTGNPTPKCWYLRGRCSFRAMFMYWKSFPVMRKMFPFDDVIMPVILPLICRHNVLKTIYIFNQIWITMKKSLVKWA